VAAALAQYRATVLSQMALDVAALHVASIIHISMSLVYL
jgi:hypothetical protein